MSQYSPVMTSSASSDSSSKTLSPPREATQTTQVSPPPPPPTQQVLAGYPATPYHGSYPLATPPGFSVHDIQAPVDTTTTSSAVVPQQAPHIIVGNGQRIVCPMTNQAVFSVTPRRVFHFDPRSHALVAHKCLYCVAPPQEKDLVPLYSVLHEPTQIYVIFAKNLVDKTVEQFVFNGATGGLEHVVVPELVYEQGKNFPFMAIGKNKEVIQKEQRRWKKQVLTPQGWMEIPAMPIKPIDDGMNIEVFPDHLYPQFLIRPCVHLNKELLILRSHIDGAISAWGFDEDSFKQVGCSGCLGSVAPEEPKDTEGVVEELNQKLSFLKMSRGSKKGGQVQKDGQGASAQESLAQ